MSKIVIRNGEVLGKYTITTDSTERSKQGEVIWNILCRCGMTYKKTYAHLVRGVIDCDCSDSNEFNRKFKKRTRLEIKEGDIFSRLTVIEDLGLRGKTKFCRCKCKCGKEVTVRSTRLNTGSTKSCGCLKIEASKNKNTLPDNAGMFNYLYRHYQITASKRNLDFAVPKNIFEKFILDNCFYCGQKPNQTKYTSAGNPYNTLVNGLDRFDNNKGYISGNIVSCCKACNFAKHSMSYGEFINLIKAQYETLLAKGLI